MILRTLAASAAVLLLSGCALLGGGRGATAPSYGIDVRLPAAAGPRAAWQLVVDEPVAHGTLAGTHVSRHAADGEYGVWSGARWVDRAPVLVQDALIAAFEQDGRVPGVGRPSSSVRGDYALIGTLRRFQSEGDDAVAVTLSAKLVRYTTNDVLAARVFDASVPVDGNGMAAVVAAFERALGELAPQIVAWTIETGEADAAKRTRERP
jgi:cholesterol transport system auxiliary component